jgi:hypothetical protein
MTSVDAIINEWQGAVGYEMRVRKKSTVNVEANTVKGTEVGYAGVEKKQWQNDDRK